MCKDVHCVAAHGGGPPLMAKATGVVASQLQKDADLNGGDFNSRPYYRMFLGLICSLPANDPTDGNAFGMLSALSNTLALVQVSVLQFHVLSGMRAWFQIAQAQWPLQRAALYSTFLVCQHVLTMQAVRYAEDLHLCHPCLVCIQSSTWQHMSALKLPSCGAAATASAWVCVRLAGADESPQPDAQAAAGCQPQGVAQLSAPAAGPPQVPGALLAQC